MHWGGDGPRAWARVQAEEEAPCRPQTQTHFDSYSELIPVFLSSYSRFFSFVRSHFISTERALDVER